MSSQLLYCLFSRIFIIHYYKGLASHPNVSFSVYFNYFAIISKKLIESIFKLRNSKSFVQVLNIYCWCLFIQFFFFILLNKSLLIDLVVTPLRWHHMMRSWRWAKTWMKSWRWHHSSMRRWTHIRGWWSSLYWHTIHSSSYRCINALMIMLNRRICSYLLCLIR